MAELNGRKMFPCPVCTDPREVRMTKKKKPYITCDPCGIQLFVRGPAGIAAFERLIDAPRQRPLDPARRDGPALLPEMPRLRMSFLDRTQTSQNQRIRRKPSRIPLSQTRTAGRSCRGRQRNENHRLGSRLDRCGVIAAILLLRHFGPGPNQSNPPKE